MRFLADMGISPRVAEVFRGMGHDAIHLHEQGLDRLADEHVLQKALCEDRILLTSDLDFCYLMAISRAALPSVVLFRLPSMRPENVCRDLELIIDGFADELLRGSIIVVSESGIRVRRLPIGQALTDD